MKRIPHNILVFNNEKFLLYEDTQSRSMKVRIVPYYSDFYSIDISNLTEVSIDKVLYSFKSGIYFPKSDDTDLYAIFEFYYEFKDEYYIFYNEENTLTSNISFVRLKSDVYKKMNKDYTENNFDLLDEF